MGGALGADGPAVSAGDMLVVDLLGDSLEDVVERTLVSAVDVGEGDARGSLAVGELTKLGLCADDSIRDLHLVAEGREEHNELWC